MPDSTPQSRSAAPRGARFLELVQLMERLLAPDGCPWDREQTLETLRPYLLEETYEVLEALDLDDPAEHRQELGDLLLQIVFQAALRQRQGLFDIDDVAQAIVDKMRRRHPHVFGPRRGEDIPAGDAGAGDARRQWSALKQSELLEQGKARRTLEGVPAALPALLRAQRLGEKAAEVGFDWPDVQGVRDKVDEELRELDEAIAAGDRDAIAHELGDVLFTLTRLSAKLGIAPEDALRGASARFEDRFSAVEDMAAAQGRRLADMKLEEMEVLWQQVKRNQRQGGMPKK